jgi:hypothetical protein
MNQHEPTTHALHSVKAKRIMIQWVAYTGRHWCRCWTYPNFLIFRFLSIDPGCVVCWPFVAILLVVPSDQWVSLFLSRVQRISNALTPSSILNLSSTDWESEALIFWCAMSSASNGANRWQLRNIAIRPRSFRVKAARPSPSLATKECLWPRPLRCVPSRFLQD